MTSTREDACEYLKGASSDLFKCLNKHLDFRPFLHFCHVDMCHDQTRFGLVNSHSYKCTAIEHYVQHALEKSLKNNDQECLQLANEEPNWRTVIGQCDARKFFSRTLKNCWPTF